MRDLPSPEPKFLTLVEANAKLPQVIRIVQRLQRLQQTIADSQREREQLTDQLTGGNGHSRSTLQEQLDAAQARQDQCVDDVRDALLALDGFGALLKDPAIGLVDFYGQRAGELIFLCWRLGDEERIEFWHTLDGGFAGRQPVDSLIQ